MIRILVLYKDVARPMATIDYKNEEVILAAETVRDYHNLDHVLEVRVFAFKD